MRLTQLFAEVRLAGQFTSWDFAAGLAVTLVNGFLNEVIGEIEQADMRWLWTEAINDHFAALARVDLLRLQPEMFNGAPGVLQKIVARHTAFQKSFDQNNMGGAPKVGSFERA